VIAARRMKELEETAALARAAGAQEVLTVPADMSDPKACEQLIAETAKHFNNAPIDYLILNHAVSQEWLVGEYNSTADLIGSAGLTMTANYMGSVLTTHAAMPYLERSEAGGHIVVVSSASTETSAPFHAAYVASKRALHGYFDTLRHELHLTRSRVSVGILVLGLIATPQNTQDEALAPLAMAVDECASEMLCSIAARWDQTHVPKWYGPLGLLFGVHPKLTEALVNANYIAPVERFKRRVNQVAEKIEKARAT
jgi:NAD(P)-dependent dehydrogenase (short-subunit alcohol dehydrogenase family)